MGNALGVGGGKKSYRYITTFDVYLVAMWLTLSATSVCKKWPEGKKEFPLKE